VPLTVQQATLVQVDGSYSLDVRRRRPPPARPRRPQAGAAAKLAEGLPGVRDWWAATLCLPGAEDQQGRGPARRPLWQTVVAQLPTYLDSDGLASYFPPRDGDAQRGSDTLTAYLLAATTRPPPQPAFACPTRCARPWSAA
jgi:hypothetical protein